MTTTDIPAPTASRVDPAAVAHFAARLAYETDASDVHAALLSGAPGFVLVDTRSDAAWQQGHLPGAVHIPGADLAESAPAELDPAVPVVVHCWGPGCNGATKAGLTLATLGYRVREMLGGFEYWAREGLPVQTAAGTGALAPDPLTAPVAGAGPVTGRAGTTGLAVGPVPAAPSCGC